MKKQYNNYDQVDYDICKSSSDLQLKFFKKCISVAQRSNLTQKHGCIIVENNQIISCGYNYKLKNGSHFMKKSSSEMNEVYSIHAEIATLKKVKNKDLTKCDMYIVRIGPNNHTHCNLKYSHPCKMCSFNIQQYGIRKVYYSVNSLLPVCSSSLV